ncbi:hypothetical protein TNIN_352511 [Trichonephila inaurata madagascariensis]|uniref:Uncharacterized protein n=1 Tax=Trichonephila inaurata madagascariensis TaxID=2747483 RepID=A0A8X7C1I2_9ARAC|nr:hypothetical protein TNIN_352511 [Trichonephila inaurata madagascariensis]
MADLCFICNESISQGDPVNVGRGLKTLKAASIERNDGHDTQAKILSKAWYDSKKRDPEEERLRIVEAAASIIREDIRSSVVETKSLPERYSGVAILMIRSPCCRFWIHIHG